MQTVEEILTVVGICSLAIGVIRFIWAFFSSGSVWLDDVTISVDSYDETVDYEEYYAQMGDAVYPQVYKAPEVSNGEEVTANFFIPHNTVIRKVKIKKIREKSITRGNWRYKTVKVMKQISPVNPLCVIVPRGEAIALYMVEWKMQYGGKTAYYFHSNLRDGTYKEPSFKYTFGIFAKIRKFFGLE